MFDDLEPTFHFFTECKGAEMEVDAGSLQRMAQYTEARWQESLVYQTKNLGKTLKDLSWR
jgi:hypothetical protein